MAQRFVPLFTATAIVTLVAFVAAAPASVTRLDGSTIAATRIDAIVAGAMRAASVPGVGVAVFQRGQIAYLKAYGRRDVDAKLPLTPDSVMTAASLTKPLFATVVMQLVDQGTLDLDAPIARYLPKPLPAYPAYADLAGDSRWRQITLRMLLDHTSGFPNWRRFTDDKKLHIFFAPGSRFAYSGEGIRLAQMVVESVTDQSLESLAAARIFEPLGMTRTSMTWQPRFASDYANGYDEKGKSLGPQKRTAADAAGGMQTTLRDYARFVETVLSREIPSPKARAIMLTPQIAIHSTHEFPSLSTDTTTANDAIHLSYGLGWGLYSSPYGTAFFKEGNDDGWRHYVVAFDKTGRGILIMTNSSNGERIYDRVLRDILADDFTPLVWEGFPPARH